jgi:tetratricopeptide (TPR) repeat protein
MLGRGRKAAHELFKDGNSADAAQRLKDIGDSTYVLIKEVTSLPDENSKKGAERWVYAWMYNDGSVDLKPTDWAPFVNDYAYYCQRAGDHDTAIKVLALVLHYCPERVVAVLNLADSEYAVGKRSEARKLYRQYLDLAKKQGVKNISSQAQQRAD